MCAVERDCRINALTWDSANTVIACCDEDGVVQLYAAAHGRLVSELEVSPTHAATSVSFSPREDLLAVGAADSFLRIVDTERMVVKSVLRDHTDGITACSFNAGGALVASAAVDGLICIHSFEKRSEVSIFQFSSLSTNDVRFSPMRTNLLASAHDDGSVLVWDAALCKETNRFQEAHKGPVRCLAFSPVNHLLLCSAGRDSQVVFYDS